MRPGSVLLVFLSALLAASHASSQQTQDVAQGRPSFIPFSGSDVDAISTLNGNLSIKIPLYSLPQRGKLALSFSIAYNPMGFGAQQSCDQTPPGPDPSGPARGNCVTTVDYRYSLDQSVDNETAPVAVFDQGLSVAGISSPTSFTDINNHPLQAGSYYVIDSVGTQHPLGHTGDGYRALDGSGFLFRSASPDPWPQYLPNSLQYVQGGVVTDKQGTAYQASNIQDIDGNLMSVGSTSITDSAGRSVPLPPGISTTSDTTGCPALPASNQALVGSAPWIVPGPNGGTVAFLFCFAQINVHTHFFNTSQSSQSYKEFVSNPNVLQSVVLPNGQYWGFTYDSADVSSSTPYANGYLTQLHLPTGGSINYQYISSNGFCGAKAQYTLEEPLVSSRSMVASDGTTSTWNYSYGGSNGDGTLTTKETAPPGGSTTNASSTGDDTVRTFTNLGGCSYYESQVNTYQGSSANSSPLKTTTTQYQSVPSPEYGNSGAVSVFPQKKTVIWGDNSSYSQALAYDKGFSVEEQECTVSQPITCQPEGSAQIAIGSITDEKDFDYSGTLLKETSTSYMWQQQTNGFFAANLLDPIQSGSVLDSSGTLLASTSFGYDENALASPGNVSQLASAPLTPRGHVTTTTRANPKGTGSTATASWYSTGMLQQTRDALQHATTYAYSPSYQGLFVSAVVNPKQQQTSFTYDENTGERTSQTDPNYQITSYTYDAIGRLWTMHSPDLPSSAGFSEVYCYPDGNTTIRTVAQNTPLAAPTSSSSCSATSAVAGNSVVRTSIVDSLGRKSEDDVNSDPSGTVFTKYTYDGRNRVYSTSNPYRTTNDSTYGLTTYSYDPLNRKLGMALPDGTSMVSWIYTGPNTLQTDENGHQWKRTVDGLERLVTVLEPDPSSGSPALETDYAYDAMNNLVRVDQWGGVKNSPGDRSRSFVYDGLSRLISSNNPETGTVTYAYNTGGASLCSGEPSDVCTRTDARNVITTYSYNDPLNRLTGKSYAASTSTVPAIASTTSVSYGYDSAAPGWTFPDQTAPSWTGITQTYLIGRMSFESNGSSTHVYGYDPVGRLKLESTCTPSTRVNNDHYDLHAAYDFAGNPILTDRGLKAIENAANPNAGYYYGGLTMDYNSSAQLADANADIVDANHPQGILGQMSYNALGEVQSVELGSQYGQVSQYDKRSHMTERGSVNLSGYTVLADQWQYDPVGNVTAANDSQQGDFNYTYDALNRVTGGTTSNESTSYTYDNWGNQTSHTVTAGSNFQWTAQPNGQNQIGASGSSFDASGNMTADGLHTYQYDAENRLAAVSDQGVQYLYDPEGLRVATESGGSVTAEYLYDFSSELVATVGSNGMLTRAILRAAETHWGDYTSGTGAGGGSTEFRLVNQVGTLVANGDSKGNYVEGCLSGPYGDGQLCTPSYDYTETHFADKLRDAATNNDYFGARYYSSTLGRFTSPDDGSDQDPSDPQSWNLYSYVRNNPLTNTDDDGRSVNVCTADGNGGQSCKLISNDQYAAAQQAGNGGLSVPSLRSVGMNGSSNITDTSGTTVGTATYVSDGNLDYYANAAGYQMLVGTSRVVNTVGAIEIGVMAPYVGAAADCLSDSSKASCAANMALALLPAGGELRGAGKLLQVAREATAAEYISKNLKGSINAVFPGQFKATAIKDIEAAAKSGDRAARTAMKLLTDSRFKK